MTRTDRLFTLMCMLLTVLLLNSPARSAAVQAAEPASANGVILNVNGDAVQVRDGGGLVKAMVQIDYLTIEACYNGLTGAATNGCGFTVTRLPDDITRVVFGFEVSDRFATVSAYDHFVSIPCVGCEDEDLYVYNLQQDGASIDVVAVRRQCNSGFCTDDPVPFTIIVY